MNIIKGFKDLGNMLTAAPDLFESAHQMADQAKAMQHQTAAPATAVEPDPANLVPVAGVDLAMYVRVSKGIAAYGYDAALLPTVAAACGIAASDWAIAQAGWAARIQSDSGVGARFNQLYTAA